MQKFRLPILFAVFAAIFLGACNSHPINKKIQMSVVGTWQGDQSGTLMTIYIDGRFILENAKGVATGTLVNGKMERGEDEIYVVYASPKALCGDASGLYRLSRKGNVLKFETLREDCPTRAAQFDKSWTLKYRTPLLYLKK